MGRLVTHREYAQGGTLLTHQRTSTWSRAGLIQQDVNLTYTDYAGGTGSDYFTTSTTTYDYRLGTGTAATPYAGAWQGVVTRVRTTTTKDMYPQGGSVTTLPTTQTNYTYTWWDSAQQARITYDSDTGSNANPVYTSTFGYDVNGRVSFVNIQDGRPRNVTFVTDSAGQVLTRREADSLATDDPFSQYYYFNGQRIGETTNDAAFDQRSYSAAVIRRTAPPSSGASLPFQGGVSNFAIPGAGFDYGYEGLRPDTVDTRGQAWTVRDGDTLQGIAAAVWGDASLWYLIAEHNGLTGASVLSPGQRLTVPAKVANLHNTSSTFRPYDPNKALGDLNPTQPAPPKKPGGCGVAGQIIAVVIAVAIVIATKGAAAQLGAQILAAAGIGGGTAAATGTALLAAQTIVGGAVIGAAAGLASQASLVVTGNQDRIDWRQVGISAISGGVSGGLESVGGVLSGTSTIAAAGRAVVGNVITQGVSVATGLQDRFDWSGVAVSAVVGAVGNRAGRWAMANGFTPDSIVGGAFAGTASAFAGAATRSLITGNSFGDNLMAALPDVIGSTIGNAIGRGLSTVSRPGQIEVRAKLDGGGSGGGGSVGWGMDDEGRRFIEGGSPAYGYQDEPEVTTLGDVKVTGRRLNWLQRLIGRGRELFSSAVDYTGADDRLNAFYTRTLENGGNAVNRFFSGERGRQAYAARFGQTAGFRPGGGFDTEAQLRAAQADFQAGRIARDPVHQMVQDFRADPAKFMRDTDVGLTKGLGEVVRGVADVAVNLASANPQTRAGTAIIADGINDMSDRQVFGTSNGLVGVNTPEYLVPIGRQQERMFAVGWFAGNVAGGVVVEPLLMTKTAMTLYKPLVLADDVARGVGAVDDVGRVAGAAEGGAVRGAADLPPGSFSISDWSGYPAGVPRPQGPLRLIEGAEYDAARTAANRANAAIRREQGLVGQPVDVHEVQPVKFGGSPTDPANKVVLPRDVHRQQVTPWWNQLQRDLGQ